MAKAASRIDFASLATQLRPETANVLNAFRRKHAELSKQLADLKESPTTIDLATYKGLKNQKVLAEAKKAMESFKPASIDLSKQLQVIKTQETAAVCLLYHEYLISRCLLLKQLLLKWKQSLKN